MLEGWGGGSVPLMLDAWLTFIKVCNPRPNPSPNRVIIAVKDFEGIKIMDENMIWEVDKLISVVIYTKDQSRIQERGQFKFSVKWVPQPVLKGWYNTVCTCLYVDYICISYGPLSYDQCYDLFLFLFFFSICSISQRWVLSPLLYKATSKVFLNVKFVSCQVLKLRVQWRQGDHNEIHR